MTTNAKQAVPRLCAGNDGYCLVRCVRRPLFSQLFKADGCRGLA